MDSQQQITHAAQAISTITVEIDALTNQIQPVVDRIKELKRVWGDQRAFTEAGLRGVASKSQ